jgi:hypothetical protein
MLSLKVTTPEVKIKFQDGRRRPVGNSSECYKVGNYHPISMKIGTQTEKNILSSKVTKAEVTDRFQDGRRRHVGNSSACYKMGNYHRTLMKIGTQTKTEMLSSKVIKAEAYSKKKQQKLNVKKRYRFKKATLYEREVIKKQKIFYSPADASILIQHVVRQS